jgi:hypothetical protein
MAAHLLIASSNGKTCGCLASFMQDAERSLAALYYCVLETYDERAAHSAAESWLQILEERLEGPSDLPSGTDQNHSGSNRSVRINNRQPSASLVIQIHIVVHLKNSQLQGAI